MKQKIKAIHLCHYSHSLVSRDFEDDIYDRDWNVRVAKQIKRYYPEIEVEVWNIERKYRTEVRKEIGNILFRTFPSSFRIRYGKEISLALLKALKKEVKECEKNKIRLIIHVHEPHNWQGIIIPLLFKNQIIFGQHHGGRAPLKHLIRKKRYYLLAPFLLLEQIFENKSLKNFNRIYYIIDKEEEYLSAKTNPSKLKYQTMGVDFDKFKPVSKKTARKKLGLNDEKIMVFVGSVIERKGIMPLIKAMKEISKKNPEIRLLIIGETEREPEYYKKLLREIEKNKLEKFINFLGRIPNNRIPLYLNAADAYIHPSFEENFGVSIIEALACNTPVIATDASSLKELIKKTGLLINPEDEKDITGKVLYFFENKNKFKNCRELAREFDWKNIIKNTVKDYENA